METLFFHGKTTDGRRFTLAGKFTQKGFIQREEVLLLGASLCSTNDSFIKKVGRYKAEGRLNSAHNKGKLKLFGIGNGSVVTKFIQKVSTFQTLSTREFQEAFNLYH